MTFDRLTALRKSMELCPPEFMMLQAIAMWAGAVKIPDAAQASSQHAGNANALSAEQFIALFGAGGELGATGTHR